LKAHGTVDVAQEFTLLTLNMLAVTIFSDGIGSDFNAFSAAMNDYFDALGRIGVLATLRAPDYVTRPGAKRLPKALAYFEEVIDEIIAVRRRRLDRVNDTEAPNDL